MWEEFGGWALLSNVAKLGADRDQVLHASLRVPTKGAGIRCGISELVLFLVICSGQGDHGFQDRFIFSHVPPKGFPEDKVVNLKDPM